MGRNIRLYPWFVCLRNLTFWQAIWFLYFQDSLSAAEALVLAATLDITSSILEVPSGYLADKFGRRITLIGAAIASTLGSLVLATGDTFLVFMVAQVLLGIGISLYSGTENALLYDSLSAAGRSEEVAAQETRAFRFMYAGLALAAVSGGVLAMGHAAYAYLATAFASAAALTLAFLFREPPIIAAEVREVSVLSQARVVFGKLRDRTLAWYFALAVAMYVFSHIPYVYGQPFIANALAGYGYAGEAPLVSGIVVACMMLISVAASWATMPLAARFGHKPTLLMAFAIQLGLVAVLAFSIHIAAIALLLLRMVPDALAKPLILAGVQPRLESSYRATFLSVQSLLGRLPLAASVLVGSYWLPGEGVFSAPALQALLTVYAAVGLILGALLLISARRRGSSCS